MKKNLIATALAVCFAPSLYAATYKVEQLGNLENNKHTYISAANDNGQAIGYARGLFNFPIDIESIDITESQIINAYANYERQERDRQEEPTFTLQDIENGVINADALSFLLSFLSSSTSISTWQKVSDQLTVRFNLTDGSVSEQVIFDQDYSRFDPVGLSRSVTNQLTGIANDGVFVGWGSDPYERTEHTREGNDPDQHFVREFSQRAKIFAADGTGQEIAPVFNQYGGENIATAIERTENGNYIVVGDSSVALLEFYKESIEDTCDNVDEPELQCIWARKNQAATTSRSNSIYHRNAMQWTFDAQLNQVGEPKNLGILATLLEDETGADDGMRSTALDVNAAGVAVGYSHARWSSDDNFILQVPAVFKDNEVVDLISRTDVSRADFVRGRAVAINSNNIVTGYQDKFIDGSVRSKFFYHDLNTGETTFPNDFFTGSAVLPRNINDNGYIIGDAEVEQVSGSNRRREAFLYKVGDETITNINDFLPCDSPYTIVEGIQINNNNEIFASARITVKRLDSKGNVVKNEETGEDLEESVIRPVKLSPIDGEVENCQTEEQETFTRQGGSVNWSLLLALPLLALRRFKKS